jgi:hypothetical protein
VTGAHHKYSGKNEKIMEIIYFAANTKDVELFILAPILVVLLPFE